jgi:hypothetical protein
MRSALSHYHDRSLYRAQTLIESGLATVLRGNTFFFLRPEHKIRIFCTKLVNNSYFNHAILFFILVSTVTLAIESPLRDP